MFPQFIVAFFLFISSVKGGACEDKGGQCIDWRYYVCHAGVESGICPGDSNIRCCLHCDSTCQSNENDWSKGDSECTNLGGECKLNSNYCDGSYKSGLCGGPANRQCCSSGDIAGCPKMISRSEWGAISTNCHNPMQENRPYLFVHHAESNPCTDIESCSAIVRSIQNYHINGNGWCDIGYSFLVGGDGNIYEGRGWDEIGAHTGGFNSVGYGVCFIGSFMADLPNSAAENIFHNLADCMLSNGKISNSYQLKGHRQTGSTDCPGDALYAEIQSWPHWTNGNIGYYSDVFNYTDVIYDAKK